MSAFDAILNLVMLILALGPLSLIPIVAMVLRYRREVLRMELEKHQLSNREIVKQIEALRQEIAQLRETSTQFDLSLQENLEHLQERVRMLEQQLEAQQRIHTY
ncbi:MAG: hypothetical protein RMJ83_08560 [Armatimonadota bacterium]|nr:hypothetical protein [Armatimonadota bacterium]